MNQDNKKTCCEECRGSDTKSTRPYPEIICFNPNCECHETPYNQKDHAHCWNQTQPPACGLKTPHKRCCLCEVETPETQPSSWEQSFDRDFLVNSKASKYRIWEHQAILIKAFIRKTLSLERDSLIKEIEDWVNENTQDGKGLDINEFVWKEEIVALLNNLREE